MGLKLYRKDLLKVKIHVVLINVFHSFPPANLRSLSVLYLNIKTNKPTKTNHTALIDPSHYVILDDDYCISSSKCSCPCIGFPQPMTGVDLASLLFIV